MGRLFNQSVKARIGLKHCHAVQMNTIINNLIFGVILRRISRQMTPWCSG